MPNRIDETFARLRGENRAAFIPYLCAGDPSLEQTVEIAHALVEAGADLLELGIPFSDPLADGVVNQLAAQRALSGGADVPGVLDGVAKIRQLTDVPVVLYTYMNPIFQFGWDRFHSAAHAAGVDGLLILDLPPDEDLSATDAIHHIRLIAPNTSVVRIKEIAARARGFLYYVSREGVTGARAEVADSLDEKVRLIRGNTSLPIAVGFGISTAAQARRVAAMADGVVIGSAIVQQIEGHATHANVSGVVGEFASPLARAIHDARGSAGAG